MVRRCPHKLALACLTSYNTCSRYNANDSDQFQRALFPISLPCHMCFCPTVLWHFSSCQYVMTHASFRPTSHQDCSFTPVLHTHFASQSGQFDTETEVSGLFCRCNPAVCRYVGDHPQQYVCRNCTFLLRRLLDQLGLLLHCRCWWPYLGVRT